jgi:hypothetical protein
MRLLTHVFCTDIEYAPEGWLELSQPLPGLVISLSAQETMKRAPAPHLLKAELGLALFLCLGDGEPGSHRVDVFLEGTRPADVPMSLVVEKVPSLQFDWPGHDATFDVSLAFGNVRLYALPPEVIEGRLESAVKFTFKVLVDGEPFAELPFPVIYEHP